MNIEERAKAMNTIYGLSSDQRRALASLKDAPEGTPVSDYFYPQTWKALADKGLVEAEDRHVLTTKALDLFRSKECELKRDECKAKEISSLNQPMPKTVCVECGCVVCMKCSRVGYWRGKDSARVCLACLDAFERW